MLGAQNLDEDAFGNTFKPIRLNLNIDIGKLAVII